MCFGCGVAFLLRPNAKHHLQANHTEAAAKPIPTAPRMRRSHFRMIASAPAPLAADLLEHDVACPPIAGSKPGNLPFSIAAEDNQAHRQCSGEGVPISVRQRDRSEATVPDDELPAFDAQVIERLELLAEITTHE